MEKQTHLIETSSLRWKNINAGGRVDVLALHHGVVAGDYILYQPRGDSNSERVIRRQIKRVEPADRFDMHGHVLVTLEMTDEQCWTLFLKIVVTIAIALIIVTSIICLAIYQ